MISLDLAQKLKDAGLKKPSGCEQHIWKPSLSSILAEIEQRGWDWSMSKGLHGYGCIVFKNYDLSCSDSDIADTPEEAAGQVLLRILQEGER